MTSLGGPCGPGHRCLARHRPGDGSSTGRRGASGRGGGPRGSRRGGRRGDSGGGGPRGSAGRSTSPTPAAIEAAVADVLSRHGRLDVLVNNAGITRDQLLLRLKRDDWDAVLDTNLTAVAMLTQAVLKPMMKQRWGRIINLTSVVGQSGNAGQANYAAAKAGLIGFTKALALEVASRGITVNAVAPGIIDTDMTRALAQGAQEMWADADSA